MLYLAEVQRKARVIGGGKAEFKLLACQRSESSWSAVQGEEILPAPEDANYNAGALVMVEVTTNRLVQRHSEAGRQLVTILQNFTRLQEKAKTQEEEIEQWKQSLTYQSQELNRREMEMEARQEQLQHLEEDFARLEQQKHEIESSQTELSQLREEFERKNQELEGAWAHLRGEMSRFEDRQAELSQSSALDEAKAHELQELLNQISSAVAPIETVREQLNLSFDVLNQQQGQLEQHWQTLEQHRASAHELQSEVDQKTQHVHERWQDWHREQAALEEAKVHLQGLLSSLSLKQDYADKLTDYLQRQESLRSRVAGMADGQIQSTRIDVDALERLALDELEKLVNDLGNDLEKMSRFVHSQEEELSLQRTAIEELEEKISHASEYDRIGLENELADERESYEMLNETLVGQRRNLQERESILKEHQAILARRKGLPVAEAEHPKVDMSPILSQVDELIHHSSHTLQEVKQQIQLLQSEIEQSQHDVANRTAQLEQMLNDVKQLEQQLNDQKFEVAQLWGKVNLYQEALQPIQDNVSNLRQKVETIAGVMSQFQEVSDYQLQAIAEIRQVILSVTERPMPEYVAS